MENTLALGFEESVGFPAFGTGPSSHALTIRIGVTATTLTSRLTIADGDASAAPRRGHLVRGTDLLAAPLEARVGAAAFQGLDRPLDPLLLTFTGPVASGPASVQLRQRVLRGERARGVYTKTVLITLSADGP